MVGVPLSLPDETMIKAGSRSKHATDRGKSVSAPACMFLTALHGEEHCADSLRSDPDSWLGPLEIDTEGKLAPLA
jgi:hypothetical protein